MIVQLGGAPKNGPRGENRISKLKFTAQCTMTSTASAAATGIARIVELLRQAMTAVAAARMNSVISDVLVCVVSITSAKAATR